MTNLVDDDPLRETGDGPASMVGEAPQVPGAAPGKILSPAALRALEEAAARRTSAAELNAGGEAGGPQGLEPTRFGDWERKGLAVDF